MATAAAEERERWLARRGVPTFGGLFRVYLVTDATHREEFRTDMASEGREVFAVRAAYLLAVRVLRKAHCHLGYPLVTSGP
jgi:hypothetical protein